MAVVPRRLIAMLLTFVPVACGGLGVSPHRRDGGAGFGSGVAGDYANRYLSAVCQYYVRCHRAANVDACRADYAALWRRTVTLLQSELDDGRVRYDAERAAKCIDGFQSASCPSESSGQFPWELGCGGEILGNVATGDACLYDFECVSGHCRWPLDDTCTDRCCAGSCAVRGDVGASCVSEVDYECVAADFCKPSKPLHYVGPGACQPRLAQGEPCDDPWDYPCQSGLTCDNYGSSTCVPYPKDGQPCNPDTGPICDNWDSFCDPDSGTCQARRAVGAPCSDYACVGYAECRNGICTLMPGAGDPCTVPDGGSPNLVCLWSATQCIDGICQEPDLPPLCTIDMSPVSDAGVTPQDAPASQALDGGPQATDAKPCLAYGYAFGVGEAYDSIDSPCTYTCLADGGWGVSNCGADH